MSEQQTELDEMVATLAGLKEGDAVTLVTDAGSIAATVTATRWRSDNAVIALQDLEEERTVRVRTERCSGWLDPLVDAYVPESEPACDADGPDSDPLRPIGSLVDVDLPSAANDQFGRRGRP